MIKLSAIKTLVTLAFITGGLFAQSTGNKPKEKSGQRQDSSAEKKELTSSQQSVLPVLSQAWRLTNEVDDRSLKVRMLARIADVMWKIDEISARKQFDEAFREIEALDASQSTESNSQQPNDLFNLRSEVLGLLARHDSQLARTLANSLKERKVDADKEKAPRKIETSQQKSLLTMQVAANIIEQDPKLAIEIVQSGIGDTLDSVVVSRLIALMFEIRRKNEADADALCRQMLTIVPRDAKNLINNLGWLAIYIIPSYGSPAVRFNLGLDKDPLLTTRANPDLLFLFLTTLQATLVEQITSLDTNRANQDSREYQSKAAYLYYFTQQVVSYLDQHFPERSGEVRSLLTQVKNYISSEMFARIPPSARPLSASDLLEKAEGAKTPQEKDSLYIQLVLQHLNAGEFEQAIAATEKINAPQTRDQLKSSVCYKASLSAISKEDLDSAYSYATRVTVFPDNSFAFAQIAKAFGKKKDLTKATGMLLEVQQFLEKAAEGMGKVRGLLALTEAAAIITPERAFQLCRDMVQSINLVGKAKTSSKSPSGQLPNVWAINTDNTFNLLTKIIFEQTIQIIREIERKELQIPVLISACRSLLEKPPQTFDKNAVAKQIDWRVLSALLRFHMP